MILLYNALAHNEIVYCIKIWGNPPSNNFDKIYIIQKQLVRHVFKRTPNVHTAPLIHKA